MAAPWYSRADFSQGRGGLLLLPGPKAHQSDIIERGPPSALMPRHSRRVSRAPCTSQRVTHHAVHAIYRRPYEPKEPRQPRVRLGFFGFETGIEMTKCSRSIPYSCFKFCEPSVQTSK